MVDGRRGAAWLMYAAGSCRRNSSERSSDTRVISSAQVTRAVYAWTVWSSKIVFCYVKFRVGYPGLGLGAFVLRLHLKKTLDFSQLKNTCGN